MCAMVTGLVSGRTLHDFARGLHLQRCLALDAAAQWEAKHLSGWADGMLADSFEALLAALFMDRGFNAAKTLVLRLIEVRLPLVLGRGPSLEAGRGRRQTMVSGMVSLCKSICQYEKHACIFMPQQSCTHVVLGLKHPMHSVSPGNKILGAE